MPWWQDGACNILSSQCWVAFMVIPLMWQRYFKSFSSDPVMPLLWTVAFIVLTHLVVIRGVRKGIEKFSNMLMPTLFILLLVIVVASCLLPGAGKGIAFLFKPDFSKINSNVLLDALGQSFFSLSLGTACLCTYASYFSRQTNLSKSALQIAGIDTLIAVLAGLMIFPAAFSVGVRPDEWSLTHLHHLAQCLSASVQPRARLYHQRIVLCAPGLGGTDFDHFHARDRHSNVL